MDVISNDTEVLSSERGIEVSDIVVSHGPWTVKELGLTSEKIDYMWSEVQKARTLFSDLTKGRTHAFLDLLQSPNLYWLEVLENDRMIGIIYLSDIHQLIDANIHIIFFNRDLSNKALLMKDVFEHLFNKFPGLHRITASIPDIYFGTKRLAIKSGMKLEGRKRSCLLIGGRWQDEVQYGILVTEVLNGSN